MASHADILDERESLGKPFLGSVALHAGVFGVLFALTWQFNHSREVWGTPNPGGAGVAINSVKTIPLPRRQGRLNPVATHDTESRIPQAPPEKVQKQRTPPPKPDAIPLKSRVPPKPERTAASTEKYRPPTPYRPNQVFSQQAAQMVSPMFAKQGAGAVGVDQASVLGSRFGAYAALLMQRVAEHWHTAGLEGVRAPFVIVSVDILRDGSIRNPQIVQSSGNYQLDTSARRAVTEAAPFQPLPREYEHDYVNVNFNFQLQR